MRIAHPRLLREEPHKLKSGERPAAFLFCCPAYRLGNGTWLGSHLIHNDLDCHPIFGAYRVMVRSAQTYTQLMDAGRNVGGQHKVSLRH